jgi:hypothetical protein
VLNRRPNIYCGECLGFAFHLAFVFRDRFVPCPTSCLLCVGVDEHDRCVFFGRREIRSLWIAAGLEAIVELPIQNMRSTHTVCFISHL